jgi:hypothetical protein
MTREKDYMILFIKIIDQEDSNDQYNTSNLFIKNELKPINLDQQE